ncbi:hypothetical protein ACWD4B_23370 [Streptomyces sp. NPDC002536]
MRNVRPRLAGIAALAVAAAGLATAPAAHAAPADALAVTITRMDVLAHIPVDVRGELINTAFPAREGLTAVALDTGLELGEGSTSEPGNGGNEGYTVPLTLDLGTVHNGEVSHVTVTDLQTNQSTESVTDIATLTCHLNALGNGSCS